VSHLLALVKEILKELLDLPVVLLAEPESWGGVAGKLATSANNPKRKKKKKERKKRKKKKKKRKESEEKRSTREETSDTSPKAVNGCAGVCRNRKSLGRTDQKR